VANGHVVPVRVTSVLCGKKQQLQIHHVVDDDGNFAVIPGPRIYDASAGSIQCRQTLGGRLDDTHVGWVSRDTVRVAVTGKDPEADVVVTSVRGLALQICSLGFSPGHPGIVQRLLVDVPLPPGEETASPITRANPFPFVGIVGIGATSMLGSAEVSDRVG